MTPSKNKTIYKVGCFICKRENHWCELKHFNNSDKCKIYCRCSCGGELKLPNHQEFFNVMMHGVKVMSPMQTAEETRNKVIIKNNPMTQHELKKQAAKDGWDTIL